MSSISAVKTLINDHGLAAVRAFADYGYANLDGIAEHFEDAYKGTWPSEQEYAENFVDDIGLLDEVPDTLRSYFDYEAFARDLFINDCWSSPVTLPQSFGAYHYTVTRVLVFERI
jgi:antirestriction protein